jgi:hypothetical protein
VFALSLLIYAMARMVLVPSTNIQTVTASRTFGERRVELDAALRTYWRFEHFHPRGAGRFSCELYRIQGQVYAHLLRGLKNDRANQSGYNVHADGLRCVYFCAIVMGMVRHMVRSKAILS